MQQVRPHHMEISERDKRDSGTCDHSESERSDGVCVNDAQTCTSSPEFGMEQRVPSCSGDGGDAKLVTIATQTSAEYLPPAAIDAFAAPVYDAADLGLCLPASLHSSWSTPPDTDDYETMPCFSSDTDTASIVSFNTSTSASLDGHCHSQHFGTKVEMVYSLLSMLGTQDREEMSRTLLAMSRSPDMCLAMRQAGCLPLLVQLLHGSCDRDAVLLDAGLGSSKTVTARAAAALHNIVHCHPDDKQGRREARALRLLEQIRAHCEMLDHLLLLRREEAGAASSKDPNDQQMLRVHPAMTLDHKPGPAIAALMKLSFDEEHRHAICTLGGLQAIGELLRLDEEVNGNTSVAYNLTMRRYACMALTNLTFGDGANKSLLCSMSNAMMALVAQLRSPSDDLRQVAASVLRNLSWRADLASKAVLRDVGAVAALTETAMDAKKESTLKSMLSALWNLSAHCSENKADICAVKGALSFLVACLGYRSATKTLAVVENAGGILRNVSSHIAVREDYRQVLRDHSTLEILLRQLRSPSLTVVSNACGTLWNLSARCATDQRALWQLGAVGMLKNLVHSKHKMISMGSAAALKNLIAARPQLGLEGDGEALFNSSMPGLHARKQRALEAELDKSLSETCDNLESPPSSPQEARQPASRTTPLARLLTNCHLPLAVAVTTSPARNSVNGGVVSVAGQRRPAGEATVHRAYDSSTAAENNSALLGEVVNTSMVGLQQHLTGLTSLRPRSADISPHSTTSNSDNWANVNGYDMSSGSYNCARASMGDRMLATAWQSRSPSPSPPYEISAVPTATSFLKSANASRQKTTDDYGGQKVKTLGDRVNYFGTEAVHLNLPDSDDALSTDSVHSMPGLALIGYSSPQSSDLLAIASHNPDSHMLPTINEDRKREAEESEMLETNNSSNSRKGSSGYLTVRVEQSKSDDDSDSDDYNDNDDDEDEDDSATATIGAAYEKHVQSRLTYVNSLKRTPRFDGGVRNAGVTATAQMSPIIRDEDFEYDLDDGQTENLYERYSGLLVLDSDFSHLLAGGNDSATPSRQQSRDTATDVSGEVDAVMTSDESMDSESMLAEAARLSAQFAEAAMEDAHTENNTSSNVAVVSNKQTAEVSLNFSENSKRGDTREAELLSPEEEAALEESAALIVAELSGSMHQDVGQEDEDEEEEAGLLECETLSFVDDSTSDIGSDCHSAANVVTTETQQRRGPRIAKGPPPAPNAKISKQQQGDEVEVKAIRGRRKALHAPKSAGQTPRNSNSPATVTVRSTSAGRSTSTKLSAQNIKPQTDTTSAKPTVTAGKGAVLQQNRVNGQGSKYLASKETAVKPAVIALTNKNTGEIKSPTTTIKNVPGVRAKSAGAATADKKAAATARHTMPAGNKPTGGRLLMSPSDPVTLKADEAEKGRSASVSSFRDVDRKPSLPKVASSPDTIRPATNRASTLRAAQNNAGKKQEQESVVDNKKKQSKLNVKSSTVADASVKDNDAMTRQAASTSAVKHTNKVVTASTPVAEKAKSTTSAPKQQPNRSPEHTAVTGRSQTETNAVTAVAKQGTFTREKTVPASATSASSEGSKQATFSVEVMSTAVTATVTKTPPTSRLARPVKVPVPVPPPTQPVAATSAKAGPEVKVTGDKAKVADAGAKGRDVESSPASLPSPTRNAPTAPPRSSSLAKPASKAPSGSQSNKQEAGVATAADSSNKAAAKRTMSLNNKAAVDKVSVNNIVSAEASSGHVTSVVITVTASPNKDSRKTTAAAVDRMTAGTAVSLPAGMSPSLAYERVVKSSTFEKLATEDDHKSLGSAASMLSSDSTLWRRTYTVTDDDKQQGEDDTQSAAETAQASPSNDAVMSSPVEEEVRAVCGAVANGPSAAATKEKKGERRSFLSWFKRKKDTGAASKTSATSKTPTTPEACSSPPLTPLTPRNNLSSPNSSPSKSRLSPYNNSVRLVSLSSDGEEEAGDGVAVTVDADAEMGGEQQQVRVMTKTELLMARRRQSCVNSMQSISSVGECSSPSGMVTAV